MKKIKHHRLDVDHRPTFIGVRSCTQMTAKDKARTRQNLKNEMRKEMCEYG